jgi:hypothetical protein
VVEYVIISGFPDYRVGDDGSVWSFKSGEWVEMTQRPRKKGYLAVTLRSGGKSHDRLVHALVLEAFIGPRPPGFVARHFPDRNPGNNRKENLSWCSHQQNQDDRNFHGTSNRGDRHPMAKISKAQRDEIVSLCLARKRLEPNSLTYRQIGERYGLAKCTVWCIASGRIRSHQQKEQS